MDTTDRPRCDRSSPASSSAPASRSPMARRSTPIRISRGRRWASAPRRPLWGGCGRARGSPPRPRSAISSRSRPPTIGVGRQGQSSDLYRRRLWSVRIPTSAPASSPAIMTVSSNIWYGDRRERLHRLQFGAGRPGGRSATAPMSAPARWSPRMSRPTRSPWRGAAKWRRKAGRRASAASKRRKNPARDPSPTRGRRWPREAGSDEGSIHNASFVARPRA